MKSSTIRLVIVSLLLLSSFVSLVVAQTSSESAIKSFSLVHFDVELSYPATAKESPVSVSMRAVAKDAIRLKELSIKIARAEEGQLTVLAQAVVAREGSLRKGDTLQQNVNVTIPAAILRGSLLAVVSETVRTTIYAYYYGYYDYFYPPCT